MWYTIFPTPPKQSCVLQACWRTQLSTKWHLQMEQNEVPQAIHLSWANPTGKQILLDTTGLNSEYRNGGFRSKSPYHFQEQDISEGTF